MFSKFFSKNKSEVAKKSASSRSSKKTNHKQDRKSKFEKISVDQLRVGMYVRELDIPWEKSSFLLQGVDVKTQQDILEVQKQCSHVWVDYLEYRLSDVPDKQNTNAFNSEISLIQIQEDYDDARQVHEQSREFVSRVFSEIASGREVDAARVIQTVNCSVSSILQNPDAAIWLTRLSEKNNHTAQHSLNVTALSIILGKTLDFSKNELEKLGISALMHDIGKAKLPDELVSRKEAIREDELLEMRKHTAIGATILAQSKNIPSIVAKVALHHHERVDGTGYPKGLKNDDIPLYARIISIADSYDWMTTSSSLGESECLSQTEAIGELYKERGKQFDEDLVIKFIDGIGVFPPGSLVEMTNGEVGIVLSASQEKLKPKVILILNQIKDAAVQQVVDLSLMSVDVAGVPYQIKSTLRDGTYGINVSEFQRAGLRLD